MGKKASKESVNRWRFGKTVETKRKRNKIQKSAWQIGIYLLLYRSAWGTDLESQGTSKKLQKKLKKYLTKTRSCDKIAELLRTELKRAESDTVYLVN